MHRLVGEQQANSKVTLKSTTQHSHCFCFDVFQCNTVIAVFWVFCKSFNTYWLHNKMSHVNIHQQSGGKFDHNKSLGLGLTLTLRETDKKRLRAADLTSNTVG